MSRGTANQTLNRAAAYVRMSTEHQQYSTSNQMDVIREYANRRGLEIVKEYSDEGKSGLNIQGRDSLVQLIRDVQTGAALFSCILVYDVSRWGVSKIRMKARTMNISAARPVSQSITVQSNLKMMAARIPRLSKV